MNRKQLKDLIKQAFLNIELKYKEKKERAEGVKECLSEEKLSEYLESRLTQSERDLVEKHLSVCSSCKELLIIAVEAEEAEKEEAKREIKNTRKANFLKYVEPIKIDLAWIGEHLKLINTNADYIPFWDTFKLSLLRSTSKDTITSIPILSKTYKDYILSVQLIEQKEEKCNILCQISSLSEIKPEIKIKADLMQEDLIISSYTFQKGTVVFSNITPGEYKIKVYEIKMKEGINPIASIDPLTIGYKKGN